MMYLFDAQDPERQQAIAMFAAVRALTSFQAVGIKPYCYEIRVPANLVGDVQDAISALPNADAWKGVRILPEAG